MPKIGEKYVCGGREFWCAEVTGETAKMYSGPVSVEVPLYKFDATFKLVGEITVGATYSARGSVGGFVMGRKYTVCGLGGDTVDIEGVGSITVETFAKLF